MPADGVVESAEDYKAAGNVAFKAGDYDEAIKQFTAAIELGALQHVAQGNNARAGVAPLPVSSLTADGRVESRPRQTQPTMFSFPIARVLTPPSQSSRKHSWTPTSAST